MDADEGKPRTQPRHSNLMTWGCQERGYWHRPWENLLSTWSVKLVTQPFPIQIQSILHPLTPAHMKNSHFHVTHALTRRSERSYRASTLREKGAEKSRQDDSPATCCITPTTSTWGCIYPSQSSPDRKGQVQIGKNLVSCNQKEWYEISCESFLPFSRALQVSLVEIKEQETTPSTTTVSNLMYFLSVFSPIEVLTSP